MAHHFPVSWPGEQLEGHHRAPRVPRKADPRHRSQKAEAHRRTRAHSELPEPKLSSQLLQNCSNVVVLTDADSRGGDQEITIPGTREMFFQTLRRVGGESERT